MLDRHGGAVGSIAVRPSFSKPQDMKKLRKIYGVMGMMEYQALIKVGGRVTMRVAFTDGSSTAIGQVPATYVTDNLMFQHAIEHSADFRSGKIKLLKTMQTDEDVYIASEHVAKRETAAAEDNPVTQAAAETTGETGEAKREFTCNDDARDFLESEFKVERRKARTRAEIVALGKSHGVEITFTE